VALWVFLLSVILWASKPAVARDINLQDMVTAKGDCHIELVKGAGFGSCDPGVIYMLFKNGRHLIMFANGNTTYGLAGSGDRQPRLEDLYMNIDTLHFTLSGKPEVVDKNFEGECHFHITRDEGDLQQIDCDVYDRRKGVGITIRVLDMYDSEHQHFD